MCSPNWVPIYRWWADRCGANGRGRSALSSTTEYSFLVSIITPPLIVQLISDAISWIPAMLGTGNSPF